MNEAPTRTPLLLVALAHENDSPDDIAGALHQELSAVNPWAAGIVDQSSIPYLVEALDQCAPDGWGFDLYDGNYGFWPADLCAGSA